MTHIAFLSRSLKPKQHSRVKQVLQFYDHNVQFTTNPRAPDLSLIVIDRVEIDADHRKDCLAVTSNCLAQMKSRGINPFIFRSYSPSLKNLFLFGYSFALHNIRKNSKLAARVAQMGGQVKASTGGVAFILTFDRSDKQTFSVPLVHTSWINCLWNADEFKSHKSFMVPLHKPQFGRIPPLTLVSVSCPDAPPPLIQRSQRPASLFLVCHQALRSTPPSPQGAQSQGTTSVDTPKLLSPDLMKVCDSLIAAAERRGDPTGSHTRISIDELNQFSQILQADEEDQICVNIGYEKPAGGTGQKPPPGEDPLLEMFACTQSFGQFD
jgi:hypothetical protein